MSRYETPSSVPAYPNVGLTRKKSMAEQIRDMVRSERLAQAAADAEAETFEEADDFDIGDDYEPPSAYEFEEEFEPEVSEDNGLDRQLVASLRRVLAIAETEDPPTENTESNTETQEEA